MVKHLISSQVVVKVSVIRKFTGGNLDGLGRHAKIRHGLKPETLGGAILRRESNNPIVLLDGVQVSPSLFVRKGSR